jgi:hypothetical protein
MLNHAEISRLCNELSNCDDSIYYAGVIDDLGQVICEYTSKTLPAEIARIAPSKETMKSYPAQVAIITSIFKLAEGLLGKSKYILSAYDMMNLILLRPWKDELTLVLVTSTTRDPRTIVDKAREVYE